MICYYGVYYAQRASFCCQDGSFIRKPSLVASDCINWKGFLGLTRQRSESNLSALAPPDHPRQRSRSEVRHPAPPPLGWREKTVVAGTRHRPRGRTIADQSDDHKAPRRSRKGQAPKPDVNLHPNGEGATASCQLLERKASPRATARSTVVAAEVHAVVEKREAKKKKDPGNNRESGKDVEKKDVEVESENGKVEERGNLEEEEEPSTTERLEVYPPEEVKEKERLQEVQIEIPPFRIDTPDYSTLESEFEKNKRPPDDIDEKNNNNLKNAVDSTNGDVSGILRDPSSAALKKVVRFDLIESYRKQQKDEDDEEEKQLDVNSNEIVDCPHMRVDLVVKPSECLLSVDPPAHLVVKKSFVLTVAKQEKGFRSLCANKRPEPHAHEDSKISVTFLCGTPSHHPVRVRSISVPPPQQTPPDVVPPPPLVRGRSRDRRSKERHSKRSKSAKKMDTSHHMPQAVIDELAQVLEKRKPSLDRATANPT